MPHTRARAAPRRPLATRREAGALADAKPGGGKVREILDEEREAILALFEEWGEGDRSHRRLAHLMCSLVL